MKMPQILLCVVLVAVACFACPVFADGGGLGLFSRNDVNVRIANVDGRHGQNVQNIRVSQNRGFAGLNVLDRGRNDVNVNVIQAAPSHANAFAVRSHGSQINVANVNPHANVNVLSVKGLNAFGTRTVVDGSGNVFEVDAFGNTQFRGNSFRGLGTNLSIQTSTVLPQPAVVSALGTSFYAVPQAGVLNFNSGFVANGGCH